MRVFFYDKTFEGLLCAVFDAYTLKLSPERLLGPDEVPPLMACAAHTVATQPEHAHRVLAALEKKLSSYAFSGLLYAALAEEPGAGDALFRYICKVFDTQHSLEGDLADPDVAAVARLTQTVGKEKMRIMGFARFQKTLQDVYIAVVEPQHNVVPLLLAHFQERFGDQPWILYDAGRGYGIHCADGRCREVFLDKNALWGGRLDPALQAEDEALYEKLWLEYFRAAAVTERRNPALQRRHMPARYWKHLPEKRAAAL